MTKTNLLFALITITLISCKDDDVLIETINTYPLSVGNSWIYETTQTDVDSNILFSSLDTISIQGIETVNGLNYYVFNDFFTGAPTELLRDSLDYLINENGTIIFSFDENFSGVYGTEQIPEADPAHNVVPLFEYEYSMAPNTEMITVKAGTFECRRRDILVKRLDGTAPDRVYALYYNKEVGKIRQTYAYASSPNLYTADLIEFDLK